MNPNNYLLFQPMAGMVLLTLFVWLWMYYTRLTTLHRSGKSPQVLADDSKALAILKDVMNPSDNFENLFEMPVLFYVAVLAIIQLGVADTFYIRAAWAFVILRAMHSLIHCTYNRIIHRFTAYALSSFVLWAMWGRLIVKLFCTSCAFPGK